MGKIQVMDCTLRDGGYLNDWKFGKETIYGVTREVPKTGVDIFELCFMRDQPFSEDRCVFSSVESMAGILNKVPGVKYAAMIETGCLLPIEMLSERRPDSIDLIRFIMWKNKMDLAYDYCRQVKEKGYDFCVQPTRTDQYSLEEFRDLILRFNELKPYGLYVVDTFGLFTKKRFLEYVEVADRYLNPDIALGYHAHNNLQQAVGNAQAFIELGLERDIIVDASVMGIGRGAGNLPLEIIGRYLNENGKADELSNMSREELEESLHKLAHTYYDEREAAITAPIMRELENLVMLKVVDTHWMEHLDAMDALREGIGLRAYGQRDPLVEYKFEAYDMFEAMKEAIVDDVVRYMSKICLKINPYFIFKFC